jgi:hypothetical protein
MCQTYIDTNNPQGMQLGRSKNRTPARFEYSYTKLIHSISGFSLRKNVYGQIMFFFQDCKANMAFQMFFIN